MKSLACVHPTALPLMRSSNKFLSEKKFICLARWKDKRAPFMLWPAVWVLWNQEVAIGVRIHRWTVGLGRWRFQCDWGNWNRADPKAPIDWNSSGLEGFTAWGKQIFDQKWTRADLDRLFKSRPEWRRLVALGGAHAHYVRLLLARELFQEPEATKPAEEGLSALEAALDIDQTEIEDATWTISQRDTTRTQGPGTAANPRRNLES